MDFAALTVGLIVAAYWARVVRLVMKIRRRTGRAANFLPPESLGRALRIVWYPTVIIWIVQPFLIAFDVKSPPPLRRLYAQPLVEWCAVAAAGAALLATLFCWRHMGRSWRMGIDPRERTELIVTGPYAYVRHPIYSLSSLLVIATLLVVPTLAMAVVALTHLTFLQWEARREENHLLNIHGREYEVYRRHVGRFIPRSLAPFMMATREERVLE